MIGEKEVSSFWEYLIFYPDEDEEGFDGEHYGGIKGISDDAPDEAKKAFYQYMNHPDDVKLHGDRFCSKLYINC